MTTPTLVTPTRRGGRPFEIRATDRIQIREAGTGDGAGVDGYASISGVTYHVCDWMGEYDETVMPGAWGKSIAEADDVRFLFDHEGMPYARSSAGNLRLLEDTVGLRISADLDDSLDRVLELLSAIRRKDVTGMSVGMVVTRDYWPNSSTRQILEARLIDVSAVTFPASESTEIAARSIRSAFHRAMAGGRITERDLEGLAVELRAGRMISAANADLLAGVLDTIRAAASDLTDAGDELDELIKDTEGTADDPDAADEGDEQTDEMDMTDTETESARSNGFDLDLARRIAAALPL